MKHAGAAQGYFTCMLFLGWVFTVEGRGASPQDVTLCSGISECVSDVSVQHQDCIILALAIKARVRFPRLYVLTGNFRVQVCVLLIDLLNFSTTIITTMISS